jgi:hypothetical protein
MEPDRYGAWVRFAEYNEKILRLERALEDALVEQGHAEEAFLLKLP